MENENYNMFINSLKNFINKNINSINKESPYFLFNAYYKNNNNNGNISNNHKSDLKKIIDILNSPSNNHSKIFLDFEINNNFRNSSLNDPIEYKILTILKVNKILFNEFSLNIDQLSELIHIILKHNHSNINIHDIKNRLISSISLFNLRNCIRYSFIILNLLFKDHGCKFR